jgi:ligand-binding sensor domain-containing protein
VAFSDHGSQTWVGTDDGLSLLDPAGRRATLTATDLGGLLPDNWINDVRAAVHENAVYLLTLRSGLTRFTPEGVQVWRTTLMTSPSVLLPLDGGVLFGTNAVGLAAASNKLAETKTIRTHGPAQGLASTLVGALAYEPEHDRLWIGVDRVDRASSHFFPALQRRHEHEEHTEDQMETTDSAVHPAAHLLSSVAGRRPARPGRGDLRP